MNEIAIVTLNGKERRKLKKIIMDIKKEEVKNQSIIILEQNQEEFIKQINENKQKREICFEKNRKRELSNQAFEKLMNEYELEGNELNLEISLIEKEIKKKEYFLRRLDYLYLILAFYDGVTTMVTKTNDGKKKKIYVKDVYNLFLTQILEEEKDSLEIEHKIMQLYMLINSGNQNLENNKFYLNDEDRVNTYVSILENREKIVEVNDNYNNLAKIDIDSIIVNDFFDQNIDSVYERLFKDTLKRNKS